MNKEQQIKDICKLICATCAQFDGCAINCKAHRDTAEALYNAGYHQMNENCAVITKAELKEYKRQAVKEFAQKLKARLAKFIWKHNIPECIFNDVIADLLKEYEQ